MVPDKSAAITNEALAQKLNIIRNTVQLWFKKDDITISNIYKIAESYGWEVNITFKLKKDKLQGHLNANCYETLRIIRNSLLICCFDNIILC